MRTQFQSACVLNVMADNHPGIVNNKTTAVGIIPVPGAKVGKTVEFRGRIPAPIQSLRN